MWQSPSPGAKEVLDREALKVDHKVDLRAHPVHRAVKDRRAVGPDKVATENRRNQETPEDVFGSVV